MGTSSGSVQRSAGCRCSAAIAFYYTLIPHTGAIEETGTAVTGVQGGFAFGLGGRRSLDSMVPKMLASSLQRLMDVILPDLMPRVEGALGIADGE